MSGVLLVTVPSSLYTTNPPLGPLYLAAALRAAGIEVRLLDLSSIYGHHDVATLAAAIDEIIALHEEIENGLLQANLVPYNDSVRRAIQRCLVFRREHNRRILEQR